MGCSSSRVWRFWLLAAVLIVIGNFGSSAWICQADEKLPDKQAVIRAVRESVSSIHSVHVNFSFWQKGERIAKRMKVTPDTEVGPNLCEWAEQGEQKLFRTRHESASARGMPTSFDSFDGQFSYQVAYEPADATKIEHVRRMKSEHRFDFLKTAIPRQFCGMHIPTRNGTLYDLLSLDSAKIVGREVIFSTPCLHVSVPDAGNPGESQQVEMDVWLDQEHDFLPRRFVTVMTNDSPRVAPQFRKYTVTYDVPELTSTRDELLNRTRFFPRVILSTSKTTATRVVVDSVVLNHSLPSLLFQPPMPKGTTIIEGEDKPFIPRQITVVGGSDAANALVDQRLREAAKLPKPVATHGEASRGYVDANARQGWNWGVIAPGVCLLILAIVCVRHLWFRA